VTTTARLTRYAAILALLLVACSKSDEASTDSDLPDAHVADGADASTSGLPDAHVDDVADASVLDPGEYDLVLLDGDVYSSKVDGKSWDGGGGKPDVFVHGSTAYSDPIESTVRNDTFTPDWMGEVAGEGHFEDGFVLFVHDDDDIVDDFMCEMVDCPVSPPNTALECSAVRGSESPSENDGLNAGCILRYQIVPH
jgi:hypothetical protein